KRVLVPVVGPDRHPRRLEDRVREHPEQTPKRGGEPLPLLDLSERRPLPDLPRMIHEHRVSARPEHPIRLAEERVRRRMHVEGVDVHDLSKAPSLKVLPRARSAWRKATFDRCLARRFSLATSTRVP